MSKKKLLIVDDDELSRLTAEELLVRDGFDVTAAADGFQALKDFEASPCHLALVDLMMPGMDGIELLERLKEKAPDLPVIIMTAHNEIHAYLRAKDKGAFEYLVKPVDFDILKQMLSTIFSPEG